MALDESLPAWGRVVLYSRASSGRFLEPMRVAAESALVTPSPPLPEGIRRWAMMGDLHDHWQLVPGDAGPELRRVAPGTDADIARLRMVSASLALSGDARVVAQLNRGRLALAWVDRVRPRLDRWPESFELSLDEQESRLLAVAVDYGDEVVCLLSTNRATYRVDISPRTDPVVTSLIDAPSRCATVQAGHTYTVDNGGRLRGWELNQRRHGIAEVSSLDAARSAGREVYALAGRDDDGVPVVAETFAGTLTVRPGTPAAEVTVVRQLSRTRAPEQVLIATGDRIEWIPTGSAP
jgi:hypothetical protein